MSDKPIFNGGDRVSVKKSGEEACFLQYNGPCLVSVKHNDGSISYHYQNDIEKVIDIDKNKEDWLQQITYKDLTPALVDTLEKIDLQAIVLACADMLCAVDEQRDYRRGIIEKLYIEKKQLEHRVSQLINETEYNTEEDGD